MHILALCPAADSGKTTRLRRVLSVPGSTLEVCTTLVQVRNQLATATTWQGIVLDQVAVGSALQAPVRQLRSDAPSARLVLLVDDGQPDWLAKGLLAGVDHVLPWTDEGVNQIAAALRGPADSENRAARRLRLVTWSASRQMLASLEKSDRFQVSALADPAKMDDRACVDGDALLLVAAAPDQAGVLLQRLRGRAPEFPIIVLGDDKVREGLLRLGASDFLPFGAPLDQLEAAVARAVQTQSLLQENLTLRAKATRLRAIVESLPEGVLLANPAGMIQAANHTVVEICGAAGTQDLLGRRLPDVFGANHERALTALVAEVGAGREARIELDVPSKAGLPRRVTVRAVPFVRDAGEVPHILVAVGEILRVEGGTPTPETAADASGAEAETLQAAHQGTLQELEALRAAQADAEALRTAHEATVQERDELRAAKSLAEAAHQERADAERCAVEALAAAQRELDALPALRAQVADLQARHEAALQEVEHLVAVTREVEDLRAVKTQAEAAEQQGLEAQRRTEETLAAAEHELEGLRVAKAQAEQLQVAHQDTLRELETLRAAQADAEALWADHEATLQEVDALRAAKSEAEAAQQERANAQRRAEEALAAAQREIEDLRAGHKTVEEREAESLRVVKAQAEALQATYQDTLREVEALRAAKADAEALRAAHEATLQEVDALRAAKELAEQLQAAHESTLQELEALRAAKSEAEAAQQERANAQRRAEEALAAAQREIEDLRAGHKTVEEREAESLRVVKAQAEALQATYQDTLREVEALRAAKADAEALRATHEATLQEVDTLRAAKSEAEAAHAQHQGTLNELEALRAAKELAEQLQAAHESTLQEIAALREAKAQAEAAEQQGLEAQRRTKETLAAAEHELEGLRVAKAQAEQLQVAHQDTLRELETFRAAQADAEALRATHAATLQEVDALRAAKAQAEALQATYQDALREVDALRTAKALAEAARQERAEGERRAAEALASAQHELDELRAVRAQVAGLQTSHEATLREVERLAVVAREVENLRAVKVQAEALRTTHRHTLQEVEALRAVRVQAEDLQATYQDALREIDTLRAAKTRGEAAQREQADAQRCLEEALAGHRCEIDELRVVLAQHEDLRAAQTRSQEECARLEALIVERTNAVSIAEKDLDALRQAHAAACAAFVRAKRSQDSHERECGALRSELSQALASVEHITNDVARARTECEEWRRVAETAEARFARAEREWRYRAESAVETRRAEHMDWVMGASPAGLVTTSLDGVIESLNEPAAKVCGYSSAEAMFEGERIPSALVSVAAGGEVPRGTRRLEMWLEGLDGTLRWVHSAVCLRRDEESGEGHLEWILVDLTEEYALEQRHRLQVRANALMQFISSATGECAALLGPVSQTVESLAELSGREHVTLPIESINAAGHALVRARFVLRQLASSAEHTESHRQLLNAPDVIAAVAPLLAELAGPLVECEFVRPPHALLAADRAQFDRLLSVVVLTGRECLPAGGRLVLSGFVATADVRQDTNAVMRPSFVLAVNVSGYGVQAAASQRVAELAAHLGGHVETCHDPGRASTIEVVLPSVLRLASPVGVPTAQRELR